MDCDECKETYLLANEDPPCEQCGKPNDLDPENVAIVNLWNRCSNFEREHSDMSGMPKRIKTVDILPVCKLYDCSRDEMELVLLMESIVYPFIVQKTREQQERK